MDVLGDGLMVLMGDVIYLSNNNILSRSSLSLFNLPGSVFLYLFFFRFVVYLQRQLFQKLVVFFSVSVFCIVFVGLSEKASAGKLEDTDTTGGLS